MINIKTEPDIKEQAQKVAASLGFSLSSLMNGYMRHLIKTKSVYFSALDEIPNERTVRLLKQNEEERKRGDYYSFKNTNEALDFIDKAIGVHDGD